MSTCQAFSLSVPDDTLELVRQRVAEYPWHEMPDDGGWEYGTNLGYMKEFCDYWINEYDWRKAEETINRFSHFIAPIDGIDKHVIGNRQARRSTYCLCPVSQRAACMAAT